MPDVVTMDVTMPGMNGIEAVKEIIAEFPDAKIVMVTALGQQKLIVMLWNLEQKTSLRNHLIQIK